MNPASAELSKTSTKHLRDRFRIHAPKVIFCLFLLVMTKGEQALAQVSTAISPTAAGVGGLRTIVTPSSIPESICSANCVITGGTRPGGGTNLFHSFSQFNIGAGDIATFQNGVSFDINGAGLATGLPTSNILARVTGTNGNNPSLSAIYGTLRTAGDFGNANLFLMNPAGFLFGPNATVNVGGMVAFTSADYLRLEGIDENGIFHADTTQTSVLTSAPVAAFGFLGSNPGAITVEGTQLTVSEGNGINLVAGDITLQSGVLDDGITIQPARLSAPGGQINLASIALPGEVFLPNLQSTPNINGQSFTAMGNISLSEGTLLDVSADAAGTVRIRGGELLMDNATISANTAEQNGAPIAIDINVTGDVSLSSTQLSALTATTSGGGNAGDIVISSDSLNASFGTESPFVPLIDSHTVGSGNGGNVTITTGPLTANGFGDGRNFIISGTAGEGNGGNITITSGDAQFTDASIDTGATFFGGVGSGGNLNVKANSLLVNLGLWGTDSFGAKAGTIDLETSGVMQMTDFFLSSVSLLGDNPVTVKADRFVLDRSFVTSGTAFADGGNFDVTARIVELSNGGLISVQALGDSKAGNVQIIASERLSLGGTGEPTNPFSPTASGIYTSSIGVVGTQGDAGNITITTPRLELTNGAQINSTTFTDGAGGNVAIQTNNVLITGERPSDDGQVIFAVGGTRASGIYTKTIGSDLCSASCGEAGSINIVTGSLTLQNGGLIDSGTTNNGSGGNITVSATDNVLLSGTMLDGTPSGVFSRTTATDPGSGNGGNILFQANSVSIQNGAQISASSSGTGAAGTVTVESVSSQAQSILIDGSGSGIFTTTSSTGTGGNITVDANAVNMTNGASITASSTGPGNTGNIQINAGNQLAMRNSTVTTEANQSGGGAIKITTNPDGTVQLTDSTISASVLDGTGGGGSVNIDPEFVILQNSQILANSVFGPGGNISITTNLLLPDTTSVISASSQFGQQGNIVIQSPVSPASGKIIPLGQKPLVATALLSQRCAALAGGSISSFTVAGRDSLPAEPGGWVSSPLALSVVGASHGTLGEEGMHTSQTEVAKGVPLLSLRKMTPAGFLTQNFGAASSDCQS
jgi:filamentous hemagglutinin family protein